MLQSLPRLLITVLVLLGFSVPVFSEGNDLKKIEDTIPLPPKGGDAVDLNTLKRAKLTEEQAVNQLKFMMVKGFARMEDEIVNEGTFPPFGLALSPTGEFKAVIADTGDDELPSGMVLSVLATQMEAIAQTRTMWGVGLMYIRAIKRDDGSYAQRIIVMTEHIAGWARHWVYPFKVVDGVVKLGRPTETAADPVYFAEKKPR